MNYSRVIVYWTDKKKMKAQINKWLNVQTNQWSNKQNEGYSNTSQKPFLAPCLVFNHIPPQDRHSICDRNMPTRLIYRCSHFLVYRGLLWEKKCPSRNTQMRQAHTQKWHNHPFLFSLDRHTHSADSKNFSPFKKEFKMKKSADAMFKAPDLGKKTKFI